MTDVTVSRRTVVVRVRVTDRSTDLEDQAVKLFKPMR